MGMAVWFNNPLWFITTTQYYFITLVILISISDLIHIFIFGVRCFFYTHFLYVIYYCSKFQLFKICQLVYSPLFSLITVCVYIRFNKPPINKTWKTTKKSQRSTLPMEHLSCWDSCFSIAVVLSVACSKFLFLLFLCYFNSCHPVFCTPSQDTG